MPAVVAADEGAAFEDDLLSLAGFGDFDAAAPGPLAQAAGGEAGGELVDETAVAPVFIEIDVVGGGVDPGGRAEEGDEWVDVIDEEEGGRAGVFEVEEDLRRIHLLKF